MSEIKVNSIKGVGASVAAISIDNANGSCTANITNNLSNRNLIINGAMQVAQRGTSFSAVQNTFTLDRFKFKRESTAANFTMSQSTISPDGFSKSLKVDCTAADNSTAHNEFVMVRYNIEAQDLQHLGYGTSAAKPLVLSFYVRSSLTGTYGVNLLQIDNSNKIYSRTYTINSADTWERKTISIPADTSGVINHDNGVGLQINFSLVIGSSYKGSAVSSAWETYTNSNFASQHGVNFASSTSNDLYLTGVQLEVDQNGSGVATDFEHRSFAQELALCQRYFQQIGAVGQDGTYGIAPGYLYNSGNNVAFGYIMPVMMRTSPTITNGSTYLQIETGSMQTDINSYNFVETIFPSTFISISGVLHTDSGNNNQIVVVTNGPTNGLATLSAEL